MIKCGGSIIDDLPDSFFKNLVHLKNVNKVQPIIVHGGGPEITTKLNELNVKTTFVNGMRVTTQEVLDVVEMVLNGSVNQKVVKKLNDQDGNAIGLSGVDDELLQATPIEAADIYGFVGEIEAVNTSQIKNLIEQNYIPVLSPVAIGEGDQHYNVNADLVASAVAQALQAPLCYVSDIPGILIDQEVLHFADQTKINQLIDQEVIYGGMIPKVESALAALEAGVPEVSIVSGIEENALMDFINQKQVGTTIKLKEVSYV